MFEFVAVDGVEPGRHQVSICTGSPAVLGRLPAIRLNNKFCLTARIYPAGRRSNGLTS